MDMEIVLSRIEERLAALGLSAHAASLAAHKPDAIRNLKRALKNGDRRGITTETLSALAPVLQTTAAWLLEGSGSPPPNRTVKVVGRIGAGAEILPEVEQIPPEGLYEIEVPFPIPASAFAFEVEGDSMSPRYDPGDIVLCWHEATDADRIIGWEAAVRTSDGRRFLKRIRRGSKPGAFDLESHNAEMIRNVYLEWAAEVQAVVRAGQWRIFPAGQRKALQVS